MSRPVALVTGAGRRVGRAIAGVLARAGCDLVVTSRGPEIDPAIREWETAGARVRVDRLELGDADAVERQASAWARELPRLDVLVHNASMYEPSPDGEGLAASALEHFRVNALAPMVLSRRLADRLAQSDRPGGGSIVAMADIHAMGRPRRGLIGYAMSKAALVEMVRTLAIELAPRIRVNAVAPGVVAFPESGPESDPRMQERYLARVPLARSGTPGDAAEAVRWLALDAAYTTGQVVRVDGGRWLG